MPKTNTITLPSFLRRTMKAYALKAESLNVTFVNPLDEKEMTKGIISALSKEREVAYDASDFSLRAMMEKYEKIYATLVVK